MRPIARQSARLASRSRTPSCNRVCQSSLARTASSYQPKRAFSSTVKRASEPKPPYGPPDHPSSTDQHEEFDRGKENEGAKAEHQQETENGEAKRKPKLKGSMRQKRAAEVPPPPPVPEWFLKHNVRLVVDGPGLGKDVAPGQVVRCVDSETGHTLFTVPYYGEDVQYNVEKHGSSSSTTDPSSFMRSFSQPQAAAVSKGESQPDSQSCQKRTANLNAMAWIFLEAEATARAGLSLPQEHRRNTFAARRVDMSLVCPDSHTHDQMDELVQDLAQIVEADVVRIDANDIAELTSEYVGAGEDSPGTFSTLGYDVFHGYEASGLSKTSRGSVMDEQDEEEFDEDEDEDEDEYDEEVEADGLPPSNIMLTMEDMRKALRDPRIGVGKMLQNFGIAGIAIGSPDAVQTGQAESSRRPRELRTSSARDGFVEWDDARLDALLGSLLDAPTDKRSAGMPPSDSAPRLSTVTRHSPFVREASEGLGRELPKIKEADKQRNTEYQRILREQRSNPQAWSAQVSQACTAYISRNLKQPGVPIRLETVTSDSAKVQNAAQSDQRRTIVHVRDLKDICRSRLGDEIIRRLVELVTKRRHAGESVLIVGTTAQEGYGSFAPFTGSPEDVPFRTLQIPPLFMNSPEEDHDMSKTLPRLSHKTLKEPASNRILEINMRHIQSMLRRLCPSQPFDLLQENTQNQMSLQSTYLLTEKVLSLDHVQRLALIAIGLSQTHAKSEAVSPVHVALATLVAANYDNIARHWTNRARQNSLSSKVLGVGNVGKEGESQADGDPGPSRVEGIKKSCNPHETRLLTGVVDAQNIKTGFGEVHAPSETVDALKTLTTLSLLRPDAFKYGVLANDRLPGLLLYGPPGTGKTLLAKAVAKESKATVLEISGAQIYEKYVGEGEKMVRAVFSLAKKLSPCIVFIDEADAIFGSRSNAANRSTHREIINQFLREWDGMDDHGVFIMVASNRPFDLDDAVLRRLPRRLLVDLPVEKDRQSILGIHLKNEALAPSVSLPQLAERTPLYSGSDLKNLCVAAALACVREENALAEEHKEDETFKLPEKRTLTSEHFEKAIIEISASISEDMSSLTAIRKFDEQFGDRKGRRKKAGYGFGLGHVAVDESSARVRSAPSPPPP